jgi:hypothetical protein
MNDLLTAVGKRCVRRTPKPQDLFGPPLFFTNGGLRVVLHTTGALPKPVALKSAELPSH